MKLHFVSSQAPEAINAAQKLKHQFGQAAREDADVIVALGGDGLMLETVHTVLGSGQAIFGMNRGSVGFLMNDFEIDTLADRIEAATYLAAVGVTGGEITLAGARPDHMDMLVQKMGEMGVRTSTDPNGLWVMANRRLRSVDVATLPYPGVATDYMPFLVSMLAVADGVSIVTENLFSGRFKYVDELVRMGADIRTEGHHAVIRGQNCLSGAPVRCHDIRAGAALVVAALGASGETEIFDPHHIDRGYADLVPQLRSIGADIQRVSD